jgi:hypothetical protein
MLSADTWVCGNCRSINPTRSRTCYRCKSPQTLAMDPASTTPPAVILDDAPVEKKLEIARRAGATDRSSASAAWMVRLAVVVVTILTLARIGFDVWVLGQEPTDDLDQLLATLDPILLVILGAAWLASFAAWGAWLRRVVANVPALGGGWPGTSPDAAFLSAAIPGSNLVWGTAVMRDVISRLSPPGSAALGLLTGWWIATVLAALPWIGRIPGQPAMHRLGYLLFAGSLAGIASAIVGSEVSEEQMIEVMAGAIMILAAALAIWLVDQIEDLQEARRRELPAGEAAPMGGGLAAPGA